VWCCVVKSGLVTFVVIMTLKDTTVEISNGVHLYLKVKSVECLCLLPVVLVLLFWS